MSMFTHTTRKQRDRVVLPAHWCHAAAAAAAVFPHWLVTINTTTTSSCRAWRVTVPIVFCHLHQHAFAYKAPYSQLTAAAAVAAAVANVGILLQMTSCKRCWMQQQAAAAAAAANSSSNGNSKGSSFWDGSATGQPRPSIPQ
jgi:hypothetical protein